MLAQGPTTTRKKWDLKTGVLTKSSFTYMWCHTLNHTHHRRVNLRKISKTVSRCIEYLKMPEFGGKCAKCGRYWGERACGQRDKICSQKFPSFLLPILYPFHCWLHFLEWVNHLNLLGGGLQPKVSALGLGTYSQLSTNACFPKAGRE